LSIPQGACWVELNCSPPTSLPLPAGVNNGDQLVWLNGAWIAVPGAAVDVVVNADSDTIFGHITPVTTLNDMARLASRVDKSAAYLNTTTGAVFAFNAQTASWDTMPLSQSKVEFVDLDTGDVYQLTPDISQSQLHGTSSTALAVSATSQPGKHYTSQQSVRTVTQVLGDGKFSQFSVTHGLGTRDVLVEIYDVRTGITYAGASVARTGDNTVSVTFPAIPGIDQYRIIIRA
jgi:hypothetical protein